VLLASAIPIIARLWLSGDKNPSFEIPYIHSEIMKMTISTIEMIAINEHIVSLGQQNSYNDVQTFSLRPSASSPFVSQGVYTVFLGC